MTRPEIVRILRDLVNVDPHDDSDVDPAVAASINGALRALADEKHEWFQADAIAAWDLVTGARECAIEIDAASDVYDALDAAELIVQRACERLDLRTVS